MSPGRRGDKKNARGCSQTGQVTGPQVLRRPVPTLGAPDAEWSAVRGPLRRRHPTQKTHNSGTLRLMTGQRSLQRGMERCGRRDGRLQAQTRVSPPVRGRHRQFTGSGGLHSCLLTLGAARSGAMLWNQGPVNDRPGGRIGLQLHGADFLGQGRSLDSQQRRLDADCPKPVSPPPPRLSGDLSGSDENREELVIRD